MFRLIENRRAAAPYYHEKITVHIYTIEELCYYLEKNTYLIDKSWLGESLFVWLEKELDMYELAAGLRNAMRKQKSVYESVLLIFHASGNYSEKELKNLRTLLDAMEGKTSMERRKMRGDLFFKAKKYRQAAYTYMELLQPGNARQMTEELRGNIMHNLGVIYARMFQFEEAAQLFAESWRLSKNEKSRECYLYAMNYLDEHAPEKDQELDLSFSEMREALAHISEVSDLPEYYAERKEVSLAADAYDWKPKQTGLADRWKSEYKAMNS